MKPSYRCCVGCRELGPKQSFWRVVRASQLGKIQLDQGEGRSAYLCPRVGCLEVASKKNKLGRALKAPVPKEIYQTLWQRLAAEV